MFKFHLAVLCVSYPPMHCDKCRTRTSKIENLSVFNVTSVDRLISKIIVIVFQIDFAANFFSRAFICFSLLSSISVSFSFFFSFTCSPLFFSLHSLSLHRLDSQSLQGESFYLVGWMLTIQRKSAICKFEKVCFINKYTFLQIYCSLASSFFIEHSCRKKLRKEKKNKYKN